MSNLHKNQVQLLEILRENIDEPLTIQELSERLNISKTSTFHHIQQLEKKGYLKRNPSNPRDYQIITDEPKKVAYINQYGLAQCGPNGLILDGNPVDRIPIASKLIKFPVDEAFIVIAKGDSMEPMIMQGDYIIAQKKSTANNNDIVVCVYKEEALIKKYYKDNEKVLLRSINNEKHAPRLVSDLKEFNIEGIVRNILKYTI